MASRRFFDGVIDDIQPPLKKARFKSPPSPHDHTLEERIMDKMSGMINQHFSKLDNRVSRLEDLVEVTVSNSLLCLLNCFLTTFC